MSRSDEVLFMDGRANNKSGEAPRLSVDQARSRLLADLRPLAAWECVATRSALGRVLAADVVAPFDVPAEDSAAMSGFALRAGDIAGQQPVDLIVVGRAVGGRPFSGIVGPGQAVRIATGAVIPAGADAVVRDERVQCTSGDGRERLCVPPGVRPGDNIRRAGENLQRGRVALAAGKRIGPAELGLLASLGIAELRVHRRLRVAFLAIGDELRSVGRALGPGEVYDSNRYTLFGALTELGVEVLDLGVVRHDGDALRRVLQEAMANADVIITTSGNADRERGQASTLGTVFGELGEVEHWMLDIKPGRPLAFGRLGEAWLFGLPGNPVALMVSFYQFVIDALLRLSGVDPVPVRPIFRVRALEPVVREPGRREYRRGVLTVEAGEWCVRPAGNSGSGVLRSMSEANCFIVLDATQGSVAVGDLVAVQMFEGLF